MKKTCDGLKEFLNEDGTSKNSKRSEKVINEKEIIYLNNKFSWEKKNLIFYFKPIFRINQVI